jgi:hypothetical protein
MLRKTAISVSFLAFVGVVAISITDYCPPQAEYYRTAVFRTQGLMLKALSCGGSRLVDGLGYACWRHVPRSWNFFGGKIRVEVPRPTNCSSRSCSLSRVEPSATDEASELRIVVDLS